jgi:small subunit ribosomal protein S17
MVNAAVERPGQRKERVGIVLSNKMQKTIVVQIQNKIRHPKLGKVMQHATKFKVHDEKNEAKIGDRVLISETRPLSKEKRWRLVEIVQRGAVKQKDELKGEQS